MLLILQEIYAMDLWKSYFDFYLSIYAAATVHDEAVQEQQQQLAEL